jgi:threonylcarbamoyladenosine tRNA methylthiotransferase MtaB
VKKRVSFKTLGCRLNQAETAVMAAQFVASGFTVVPFDEPSDVCVIHSCTITAKAERESRLSARAEKRRNNQTVVVLAGCAVEAGATRLAGVADILAGQEQKQNLPAIVDAWLQSAGRTTPENRPVSSEHMSTHDGPPRFDTTRALVRVQDGCSFHCSYCIVPHARGPAASRSLASIVEDCVRLADAGHREIVLVGANIGCFEESGRRLPHLLAAVEKVAGIERVRISSIEPATVERELIDYMIASPKVCRYLHLPMQSGDDGILRIMRRRYTVAEYRNILDYAISRIPYLGLGTDIITGFPGETLDAFANTVKLVEQIPFSNLHVFPYSPRPGTPAASLPNHVPRPVARQRAANLIALGKAKRSAFARQFIGRPVKVLTEATERDGMQGWTGEYIEARMDGPTKEVNTLIAITPEHEADGVLYARQGPSAE